MAHLVPIPPPADAQVPNLKNFSIVTSDGIGEVLVWGAAAGSAWRVGTEAEQEVYSTELPSSYPNLRRFQLRGVRQGMKLALYQSVDEGRAWQRYSPVVSVDYNMADHYAAAFLSGSLPKSKHNKYIRFYPFGAQQAAQPMSESDWMDKVEAAIGKVAGNVIGRLVLSELSSDATIYPYLSPDPNAISDVHINPAQWVGDFRPGAGVDELILHEFIHRIERKGNDYEDRFNFEFDGTDFLTVNATNVYSGMIARALRKDHAEFDSLPAEQYNNPKIHYQQQKPNYAKAARSAPKLVAALAAVPGVWNPFKFWAEDTWSFAR